MSDYIKREDALRSFNGSYSTVDADDILRHLHKSVDVIKNIPSADVVEVVRCKDCKHRTYDRSRGLYYCNMYYGMGDVSDGNYCSYGERTDT